MVPVRQHLQGPGVAALPLAHQRIEPRQQFRQQLRREAVEIQGPEGLLAVALVVEGPQEGVARGALLPLLPLL